ncbi:MAG: amidohydrolase [Firmicutes bacterium]|nr:amidohydrolase [Bacillota bacterium]
MNIMQEILKHEDYMIEQRRYLHRHPETSAAEFKTIEHLSEELTAMGIPHDVVEDGGILAYIEGKQPGKTVLLRADCDALKMSEQPNNLKQPKVAVSENPGACHACGHDGHSATLLTVGKVLFEHKDEIHGTVILMFERGEEGAHCVTCLFRHIEDKGFKIDTIYGNHVYNGLKTGEIALLDGPTMSGSMVFDVKITGRGGHGSRPDLSVNPVDCFVAVYNDINALRMKKISPFRTLTFSVGKLISGGVLNIIPDDLSFGGTVRVFDLEDGRTFLKQLKTILDHDCAIYDCTWEFNVQAGPFSGVINDPDCAALARKAVAEAVGAEHVITCEPWMASESFALSQQKWPGVFGLVGITNEEVGSGAAHHNGQFDIDEAGLKYSAASYIAYALAFLDSDLDTSAKVNPKSFAEIYRDNAQNQTHIDFLEHKIEKLDFSMYR